jgi:hypothetical protein
VAWANRKEPGTRQEGSVRRDGKRKGAAVSGQERKWWPMGMEGTERRITVDKKTLKGAGI